MNIHDFYNDAEKMKDFDRLSKEDFLSSYSYITPEAYDRTKELINYDSQIQVSADFGNYTMTLRKCIECLIKSGLLHFVDSQTSKNIRSIKNIVDSLIEEQKTHGLPSAALLSIACEIGKEYNNQLSHNNIKQYYKIFSI